MLSPGPGGPCGLPGRSAAPAGLPGSRLPDPLGPGGAAARPPGAGRSPGMSIPSQALPRGVPPASPRPAPPGRVVVGWQDDNRKCICRLPSNFLMGASWKRTSRAVPLRSASGDLEGDNHELLSGKTKKWKNLSGPAALSHCISREPVYVALLRTGARGAVSGIFPSPPAHA